MSIISFAPDVRSLLAKRGAYSGTDCTMKEIELTQGKYAIVDDEDFEWLNSYKWHAAVMGRHVYATRIERVKTTKKRKTVYMHREVLKPKANQLCDHIDFDGLNNTRANLRVATKEQNQIHARAQRNRTSAYKGVMKASTVGRWIALVTTKGKHTYRGTYKTEEEAATAYNEGAKKYHGEFTSLNRLNK